MADKVIQITSSSPSFSLSSGKGDIEEIMKDDWSAQVAKHLKESYPNLEIECWTPEKNYKKERAFKYLGIKFRAFPTLFSIRIGMEISFSMIKAIREEIKKAEQENKKLIIHVHEYHSWLMYLLLLTINKSKNIKIIAQHHGGRNPLQNLRKYKRLLLVFPVISLMQFFENLLYKKVDIFYAFGDKEEKYLRNITQSEIKFQSMGIRDLFFEKVSKKSARKTLNLDKKKKYVLFLGRIKTTKGIRELLEAMKDINAELLLIGSGPDMEKYSCFAKKNGIENVSFLGPIYSDKRLLYLSACDCLVLPSYTEGAPVVIMEAIARNLPVVASDVGAVSKMITNGREGIVIKPQSSKDILDAVNKVLCWKSKDIRKYAERYKWDKIIKEMYKDYLK